jgi:hypothetical protein
LFGECHFASGRGLEYEVVGVIHVLDHYLPQLVAILPERETWLLVVGGIDIYGPQHREIALFVDEDP